MDRAATRTFSSRIFNNDKFIEVVLVLDRWDRPTFTAQEVARELSVNHDLVKKVLNRLEDAGLIKRQERLGGTRGALPYQVQPGPIWASLVAFAKAGDRG